MAVRETQAMNILRLILPYLRPHWRLAGGTMVLTLLGALSSILAPWPMKLLIDSVLGSEPLPGILSGVLDPIANDRYGLLIFVVLAGLFLTIMVNGMAVLEDYVSTSLDQRMVLDFRSDLFRHAQRLSAGFFERNSTGKLMFRFNNAGSAVGKITVTIPDIVRNVITLVGMFIVVLFIDAELALLSLAVVPFLYYSVGDYSRRVVPRMHRVRAMEMRSISIVHEAITMLRVVAAFNREDREYRKFRDQGEEAVDARIGLTVRQTMFSLVVDGITAVGLAAVLGLGAHHVIQGELTIGELLVIVSYIQSVYTPLQSISNTAGSLQEDFVRLNAAMQLLHAPVEVTEDPDAIELGGVRGDISYQDVHFAYSERLRALPDIEEEEALEEEPVPDENQGAAGRSEALRGISFDVNAGQVIAVVGPTGAGKTTLVSLLTRFFDPDEGRVLIDGTDIRKVTLASLRQNVSVVMQEPLLFADTIRENIRYGRLDATQEEIIEAAKNANAHRFIRQKKKKYNTRLGERGAQLSGGERQRISIARAFLKDAPILILDEPTSSIDSRTESVILNSLERLMQGRTTIMIAHRLSTIRNADLIFVMDEGCLVEQGTHEELMANGGLYRQLYNLQSSGSGKNKQSKPGNRKAATRQATPQIMIEDVLTDVIPDEHTTNNNTSKAEDRKPAIDDPNGHERESSRHVAAARSHNRTNTEPGGEDK